MKENIWTLRTLVERLSELIPEYGDLPVYVYDTEMGKDYPLASLTKEVSWVDRKYDMKYPTRLMLDLDWSEFLQGRINLLNKSDKGE